MKGAGGGTIEKIQNKNGGSPAESIRGTAAVIFYLPRKVCGRTREESKESSERNHLDARRTYDSVHDLDLYTVLIINKI